MKSPAMPVLVAEGRESSLPKRSEGCELPLAIMAAADDGREDPTCSFPLHLVSHGLIFHVLDYMSRQGHAQITNRGLDEILV